jgi:hypothetical protein
MATHHVIHPPLKLHPTQSHRVLWVSLGLLVVIAIVVYWAVTVTTPAVQEVRQPVDVAKMMEYLRAGYAGEYLDQADRHPPTVGQPAVEYLDQADRHPSGGYLDQHERHP